MLSDFRGQPVILVFYPADWSPVCGDQLALYNECCPSSSEFGAELLGDLGRQRLVPPGLRRDRKLRFPLLADFEPKGDVARPTASTATATARASGRCS